MAFPWISRDARLLRTGQRALAKDDHPAAIAAFEAARAKTWLARALAAAGREDDAERAAAEAAKGASTHVAALELGIIRLDRGDPAGAREAFAQAAKVDPQNPLVRGFAALARWDEDPSAALGEIVSIGGVMSSRFQARWLMAVEKSWQEKRTVALPEGVLDEGRLRGFELWRAKRDVTKLLKAVGAKRTKQAVLLLAYLNEGTPVFPDPSYRKRIAVARERVTELLRADLLAAEDDDTRRDVLFELASAHVDGGDPLPARPYLERWLAIADPKDRFTHRIVLIARADVAILGREPYVATKHIAEARLLDTPASPDVAREMDRIEGVAKLGRGDGKSARVLLERLFSKTLYRVEERVRQLWS